MDGPTRLSVLLIEDNAGDARVIQETLIGMWDVRVDLKSATHLSTALEQLAAGGIDVILLDLSLPDSQGLETFLRVHERFPGVPVVVLSGLIDEGMALEAVQKGAQDYLNKAYIPVDGAFLVRSIRYAIERNRAEHELLRLASFPEQSPDAIVETSAEGTVTYANPAARAQFPDLETRVPRHPVIDGLETMFPARQDPAQRSLTREVTLGKKVYEQHLSRIPDTGLIRSYIIDITERKQIEHLKDEFLSTVSHELRTPLTTMKEFVGIIRDQLVGPVTAAQREYLGIIQGNIERFARIINDLLAMAKIEAGHIVVRKELLDLQPLAVQVIQSMRSLADHKRIELILNVPDGVPELFADADKVTQVLMNLIGNAIKFVNGPGRVTIGVADRPGEIQFSVTDTGVGISADDLPTLFEKFRQVRSAPVEGGPVGTGLGLAISKRLVELQGGRIWATSQLGRGSTFSFTLPKYEMEEVLETYLRAALEQAGRAQGHLSVILLEVGRYDALKAQHGPAAADRLLREVEAAIRQSVRRHAGDTVIRWKEDKVIVALEMDAVDARLAADSIKRRLEQQAFAVGSATLSLALSAATATFPEEASSAEELLLFAERQLPRAGHLPH